MNFSEAKFYEVYLTLDFHTNTVFQDVFAYPSRSGGFQNRLHCRRKSFEWLNSPKFQFVKWRKLSDLYSKIYKKSLN